MMPDRSNYEIWFIDWLDGRLSDQQVAALEDFLAGNPDLAEEFRTLSSISLKPQTDRCSRREDLFKKPSDLSPSQFEYLCIADLENDLSPEGILELEEAMAGNEERKKEYDLTRRIKLSPPDIRFKHKDRLRRTTPLRKLVYFSVIGLSAAAAVTMFVIFYNPGTPVVPAQGTLTATSATIEEENAATSESETTAVNGNEDESSSLQEPVKEDPAGSRKASITLIAALAEDVPSVTATELEEPAEISRFSLDPVPLAMHVAIRGTDIRNGNLMAFTPEIRVPLFDDGRSNMNRFLARVFHEKIMRDTIAGDRPVKVYDIAGAGIAGINKLFGTALALEKNTDDTGTVTSVYFSSRLVKFNAPVRKSEIYQ